MINNNKLNDLIPLQEPPSLAPSSTEKSKTQESKGVKSPSSAKVSTLPFPDPTTSESDKKGQYKTKRAQMSDSLLQELDRILSTQAEQIEKEFKDLESQANDKELVDAILGIEGWGYDILNYTNTGVQSGVDFLGKVLPRSILDHMPPAQKWEELGSIASLGATLLSALDTGAQGVALICKHKILEQSKEFLKEFKANFAKQIESEQAALKPGELKEAVLATPKNKKMQKAIEEWELQIAIEEKGLKEEKFQFGLTATTQALTLLIEPFNYIPKELIFRQLSTAAQGISWAISGLEIFGAAIELKQERKNSKTLNQWMESYQKWQDEHLPKFEITDKGAKRIGFNPRKPVILSAHELESMLLAAIKTKPLSYVRTKLKECGIELLSTIKKKKELLSYLKANPKVIEKYVHFQHQLENLNTIIYTSENLLAKRTAIMDKKILLLKSRFSSIEPQIRERKEQAFVKDMENLKEALQNPQCNFSQVEERLSKWEFLNPNFPSQNSELISAFKSFENTTVQERTALHEAKQHLIDELNAWKNRPGNLDQHYEMWYQPQISEEEKQAFAEDMQRLTEILQNPYCTFEQVDEQLTKLKILNPYTHTENPQLIAAFGNLKNAMVKTSVSDAQQHLLDKLNAQTSQANALDKHFEVWYEAQDKEDLIKDYIDHQETIEHTTKNALKQMVQQKHELESRFQSFKLTKSTILFAVSVIALTVSVVFAILGLVSLPVGGAGSILLGVSILSASLSFGFLGLGYMHSRKYKPNISKEIGFSFNMKLSWAKLRASISTYSHRYKEKKLIEVAKILQKLHQSTQRKSDKLTSPEYQNALANYQEAKLNFENSQKQVDYWTNRLKRFESKLNEVGWKDFAQYANLQIGDKKESFDTLNTFKTAFEACDLRLLNPETRDLLEVQLGINLEVLQKQMKNDPEGVKKSLQEFFALGDAGLIDFIRNQKARIKKGLLRPQVA